MAFLEIKNVSKSYANKHHTSIALKQISFGVNTGEFVVVVGPSGSGKTTLLRVIAGLEHPDDGSILIEDRNINKVEPDKRDVALVFQDYALFPHLTVFDNLSLPLKLRKYDSQAIRHQVNNTAELLGITSLFNRKPSSLSGGEKQRVALGRALIRQPKLFLFDEPLSQLDAPRRIQLRREIYTLCRQQKVAAIYTTHDQIEAMSMGDKIVVLSSGHLQQIDEPTNIYHQPCNLFVAGFFGLPPMNLLPGIVIPEGNSPCFQLDSGSEAGQNSSWKLPIFSQSWAQYQIRKPCVFGIRPEHIRIRSNPPIEGAYPTWRVRVERVEFQGSSQLVHLRAGSHHFYASQSLQQSIQACCDAWIEFDMIHSHWFATDTGLRLHS